MKNNNQDTEYKESKSIVKSSMKKALIPTGIMGIIYVIGFFLELAEFGFTIDAIYYIIGSIMLCAIAWFVAFLFIFIILAIAKAVED
jgi:hypothetical protein